uniref:PH domain-containing protein n=1 Tax=Lotharella globosa TaxID=91324 RepID=A0A7S3Z415_9EUKA
MQATDGDPHEGRRSHSEIEDEEDFELSVEAYQRNQQKRSRIDGSNYRDAEAAKQAFDSDMKNRMESLENAFEPGSICHQEYLAIKNIYESWQLDNRLFTISEESADDIKMEEILTKQEQARVEKAKKDFFVIASLGQNFIKHGRAGKPHLKTVRVDTKTGKLWWDDQSLYLQDVTEIKRGKHTKVFDGVSVNRADPRVCFSIVTPHRTLDLQASSFNEREMWVDGLTRLQLKLQDNTHIDHKNLDSQSQFLTICQQGRNLTKWSLKGVPGTKLIMVNPVSGKIKCGAARLYVQEVDIVPGKTTQVFEQVGEKVSPELCFSLVHAKRSLDLSATSQIERDMWVSGLRKLQASLRTSQNNLKKEAEALLTEDIKKTAADFMSVCTVPTRMSKFTRSSSKHKKMVTVDPQSGVLSWGNGSLNLKHVISLESGKTTKVLQKTAEKVKPELCFSLILPRYTLDLKCQDQKTRDTWVAGLQALKIVLANEVDVLSLPISEELKKQFAGVAINEDDILQVLDTPREFIKHGRTGRPHSRKVTVDRKEATINWATGSNSLKEAYDIVRGKSTKVCQMDRTKCMR